MTTVIVTGGSGFIGSHLIADLNRDASVDKIVVLDKNEPSLKSEKLEFIRCDLRQSIIWQPNSPSNVQCFHLAAVCREPGFEWDEYFAGNYTIANRVAEWASRVGLSALVFTSTSMVFRASDERNSELGIPNPDTAYGISKALAEERFRGWAAERADRKLHIIRPGVVFGRGGGGNFARLYRALRRNMFCYVGRRTTIKSSIYVKDLVRILRAAANQELPPNTYHALYSDPLTVQAVCEAFCEVYGWRRYVPTLPYGALKAVAVPFEVANNLGIKNPIHPRRIEKLYNSTDLSSDRLIESGFRFEYDLVDALRDWRNDCLPEDLY